MPRQDARQYGWSVGPRGEVYFLDKKWHTIGLAIGVFLVLTLITAIVEFILAARFEHGYGVLVSLISYALALAGLIAILNSNFFAKFKRWWRLVVWIPNTFFFIYLVVLLSVRWAAPDHPLSAFPASCRHTTNCCRLTPLNTTNVQAEGLTDPVLQASFDTTDTLIETWASGFENVGYIRRAYNGTLYQLRFVSSALGFPDDFYVSYTCTEGSTVLSIQSEARLGVDDLGGNRKRIEGFLSYLTHATVNPGTCSSSSDIEKA